MTLHGTIHPSLDSPAYFAFATQFETLQCCLASRDCDFVPSSIRRDDVRLVPHAHVHDCNVCILYHVLNVCGAT